MKSRFWIATFASIGSWLGWQAGDYLGSTMYGFVGLLVGTMIGAYAGVKFVRGFDDWIR